MGRKRSRSARFRIGKVSGYLHHGAWWLYYRDEGNPVRRKVAMIRDDAEKLAAQINAQVAAGTPTLLSFNPISVAELRAQFRSISTISSASCPAHWRPINCGQPDRGCSQRAQEHRQAKAA